MICGHTPIDELAEWVGNCCHKTSYCTLFCYSFTCKFCSFQHLLFMCWRPKESYIVIWSLKIFCWVILPISYIRTPMTSKLRSVSVDSMRCTKLHLFFFSAILKLRQVFLHSINFQNKHLLPDTCHNHETKMKRWKLYFKWMNDLNEMMFLVRIYSSLFLDNDICLKVKYFWNDEI